MRTLTALLLFFAAFVALAQQAPDAAQLQRALTRAQGLLQQLSQQKALLQAESVEAQATLARAQQQLAAEQRQREDVEADLAALGHEKRRLNARLEATSSRLTRVETRLEEVVNKYKALATEQRTLLGKNAQLESELATTQRDLADARERNETLYQANAELLDKLMKRSAWDGLLGREPLTGIKYVELENIEQQYRFINEDARLGSDTDAQVTTPE